MSLLHRFEGLPPSASMRLASELGEDVPDATPEQLAGLRRSSTGPRSVDWSDLLLHNAPGTRDRRGMARVLARLGLHPIAIHGLTDDGCTCDRPDRPDCAAHGKHPVLGGWQRAPLDIDTLDRMLASNWRLNLGLRMGQQPNGWFLVAIDVDGPRELLEPLERQHGALPPTLTARTGSGGLHLIYRLSDPSRAPRNRVRMAPGIDVRSEGGQIVCSPSLHQSGGHYTWIDAREPEVLY